MRSPLNYTDELFRWVFQWSKVSYIQQTPRENNFPEKIGCLLNLRMVPRMNDIGADANGLMLLTLRFLRPLYTTKCNPGHKSYLN